MENIENRKESYVSVCKRTKRRNKRKLRVKTSKNEDSSSGASNTEYDSSVPSSPVNISLNDSSSESRNYFLPKKVWETMDFDFQTELQKQIKQRWKNDIEYADSLREKLFNSKKNFPNLNKNNPQLKHGFPAVNNQPPGLNQQHPSKLQEIENLRNSCNGSHGGLQRQIYIHGQPHGHMHGLVYGHGLHGSQGLHGLHGHGLHTERQFSQSLPELTSIHNEPFVPIRDEYNPIPSPPLFVEKEYYDRNPFVPTKDIIKQQSYYN